ATNAAGTGSYSASSASVTPALDFVSTWNTDGPSWASGTSASNQIRLPLESSGNYNFRVQWGDGTENIITSWDDANKTHTYASLGSYTVRISGTITGFRFNTSGDRYKLINISQFGPLRLGNNGSYFAGLVHLTITATDPLDLTGTTNLSRAFAFCESLSTVPSMPYWDTSNVTNMSAMFQETYQFNEDIASWNTSNVTDMSWMFFYSENFDRAIGTWDTSKVTDMSYMFYYTGAFNQNIGSWNTANVTKMPGMFALATAFNQDISSWDVTKVSDMSGMFYDAPSFSRTNYDALLLGWSAQNVKSGVSFSAGDTKYSSGNAAVVAARALLTNSVASGGKNWTITDGGGQAGAPGVPTTVSGTAGSSQVSLSWSAPSDDGGSAITDYVVQYSANGSTWTSFSDGTSSLTSATVTGLTPGTAYVFQVAATNAA
ncbi:MAG: BspA family leucine-rich repeat surface protein, partial [Proteobacteria bacterium]|nr:BspA family leucine-rich repeat surface protein [Pseudomonadota bacterium]